MMRWLVIAIAFTARAFGGFEVPEGFKVERATGTNASEFPMFAGFDNRGRLFVAESSGLDLYAELSALTRKCRVRLLEDSDGDGKFETATVFADKLVYPMGLAWREGRLYVADPPNLITITEDGTRTVILSEFGHKDNGSLHGLTFGPDGWLYMTTGSADGYKFKRADGSVLEGVSGALIRCRPDGSDVEVVARGFENLVEVVFTPEWEIIGTDNWFRWPEGGVRDALVHLVRGGLYPRHKDAGTPQIVTGEPLPPISLYPAVALSGLMRYGGAAYPEQMRGNLFSAQHNARKVQRHVLIREGSTYRAENHDFLTTDDPDFHPSDVLESPDGSVLVLDTGSWYTQHCPTGKIRNSQSRGGIYRVSYKRTASTNTPAKITDLGLARAGQLAAGELVAMIKSGQAHEQLAAAEALARFGSSKDLPFLWEALGRNPDRFLEHAIIYAIHRHADSNDLRARLNDPRPRAQAAAVLLLDQPTRLAADEVLARALSVDPQIRRAAIMVLRRHPEWTSQLNEFLRQELAKGHVDEVQSMLIEMQKDDGIQKLIGRLLDEQPALLPVIAQTSLPKAPASWVAAIRRALESDDVTIRLDALRAANALGLIELLRPYTVDKNPEIRLAALKRQPSLTTDAVQFLNHQITNAASAMNRFAARDILQKHKLIARDEVPASNAAERLRDWEALLKNGNPERGRGIFFSPKAACGTCHAIGSDGGKIGPDLTKVGAIRSGRDILESILFPSSTFAQGYQPSSISTIDGAELQGVLAREAADTVWLRDASGTEMPIRKEQIREMKPSLVSLMPSGLEQAMTRNEFADLLAYLQGLK